MGSAILFTTFFVACSEKSDPTPEPEPEPVVTYEVTFDFNGKVIHKETVADGEKCPYYEPSAEEAKGYKFVGWYETDPNDLFDFEVTKIHKNIKLNALAKKLEDMLKIKFDANGVEVVKNLDSVYVDNGATFGSLKAEALAPKDKDFSFVGWSYEKVGGAVLQNEAQLKKSVTLYAKWAHADVKDVEGNVYPTMVFGRFVYMAENLRTKKYNDGTDIAKYEHKENGFPFRQQPQAVYTNFEHKSDSEIEGDPKFKSYGRFYSYGVVCNDPALDDNPWGFKHNEKNVCPKGWHVPTFDEAQWLMMYLDPSDNGQNDWSESAAILVKAGFLEGSKIDGHYNGQFDSWSFNGDDLLQIWMSSGWIGDWGSDGGWTPEGDGKAYKQYPQGRNIRLGKQDWPLDGRPCAYFQGIRCLKDLPDAK